jgi:hypothetical protein
MARHRAAELATCDSSIKPTLLPSQLLRFEHYEILTREDGTPVELATAKAKAENFGDIRSTW